MAELMRHVPPEYDHRVTYLENFDRFFDWANGLIYPATDIVSIGERLGLTAKHHPLGFTALYLSERHGGSPSSSRTGLARVNIYPAGEVFRDDPHCHGFDFKSGVAAGGLINTMYNPDFSHALPDGEGYIGYETRVNCLGVNSVTQVTDAVVDIGKAHSVELSQGQTYEMRAQKDFHSVAAMEEGAVTIFCKTPASTGVARDSLLLRLPDQPTPPESY